MRSIFYPVLHLAPSLPELFLHRSFPCLFGSASFSPPWWCPSHGNPWDGPWVHSAYMSSPHPPSRHVDIWQRGQPCSSVKVLETVMGQKILSILLRHLLWNTFSLWQMACVTFRDCPIQEHPEDVALNLCSLLCTFESRLTVSVGRSLRFYFFYVYLRRRNDTLLNVLLTQPSQRQTRVTEQIHEHIIAIIAAVCPVWLNVLRRNRAADWPPARLTCQRTESYGSLASQETEKLFTRDWRWRPVKAWRLQHYICWNRCTERSCAMPGESR